MVTSRSSPSAVSWLTAVCAHRKPAMRTDGTLERNKMARLDVLASNK